MKNKIALLIILILLAGCIEHGEEEKIPDVFKTKPFRIGDKVTYELFGKATIQSGDNFFIYVSRGEAKIEIKEVQIEDGFGKKIKTIEFYMSLSETPYNYTPEGEIEELPINLEKHIYRIYDNNVLGGIIKSDTIHHAINRHRQILINSMPINDFLDNFLQREFKPNTNGSFIYEGRIFNWSASYDEKQKALQIVVPFNTSKLYIWIKNDYSFPYQIAFETDYGNQRNSYSFVLKSFKRGSGKELNFGFVNYTSLRNFNSSEWKDLGPAQGESQMKMSLREAVAIAYTQQSLKNFLKNNPGSYLIYAEYWESKEKYGWILYFGKNGLKKEFVLNVTEGAVPIVKEEINPYFPYEELPKNIEDLPNQIMDIGDAEKIFKNFVDYNFKNFTFKFSFIEIYYPDTLFDIWEGNDKEKEISIYSEAKKACSIEGFSKLAKDWQIGYRLVGAYEAPFISFDGKIDGENGMVTYIYKEY